MDEAIDAEIYVNKASALINAVTQSHSQSKSKAKQSSSSSAGGGAGVGNAEEEDAYGPVQLRFRVTYARVLDANRKFAEAAVRYYALSTTNTYNVSECECESESEKVWKYC